MVAGLSVSPTWQVASPQERETEATDQTGRGVFEYHSSRRQKANQATKTSFGGNWTDGTPLDHVHDQIASRRGW
jgi:hypothetical protein